eukprot:6056063-Amphidinium_carterae.1
MSRLTLLRTKRGKRHKSKETEWKTNRIRRVQEQYNCPHDSYCLHLSYMAVHKLRQTYEFGEIMLSSACRALPSGDWVLQGSARVISDSLLT